MGKRSLPVFEGLRSTGKLRWVQFPLCIQETRRMCSRAALGL